jgi:hypothetical protein
LNNRATLASLSSLSRGATGRRTLAAAAPPLAATILPRRRLSWPPEVRAARGEGGGVAPILLPGGSRWPRPPGPPRTARRRGHPCGGSGFRLQIRRHSTPLVGAAGFGAAAVAGPGWFVLWFLHLYRGTFMAPWWRRGVWRTIYPAGDVGGGGERFLSQVCRCAAGQACRAKVFADTLVGGDGSGCRA